ncbi:MAG TPA: amino acid adenylation domain-containing protein, partial [Thermoanaerobaculia bacterium]|nr:amino acid adenylation domain-containing protein [Thermoanaerobaculia bacterium]
TVAGFAAEVRGGPAPKPIPRVPRSGPLPLSFAQERVWFLEQLNPGTSAFNLSPALRLEGRLDVPVLAACFDELVRRHESLRTRFAVIDRRPAQVIDPAGPCPLSRVDLEALAPEVRAEEVRHLAVEHFRRPFDLARGPLFRANLLRLEETSHVLLLDLHHAIADGWSIGLMTQELVALYEAFLAGRPSPLPELPIQPADFAVWQREELSGERLEDEIAYWRRQIGEIPARSLLPFDRPRPQTADLRGKRLRLDVPAQRLSPLKQLGRRQGATLFMSLVAILATQLHRYGNAPRVPLGTPIANRNRSEIEGLIGMFVNTLVLAVDLSAAPTFSTLLERVREVTLGAYEHQDLPYEKLVQALQPDRKAGQQGLFQVFFALANAPVAEVRLPSLGFHGFDPQGTESVVANFDLNLLTAEDEDGALFGGAVYSTALFDEPTVRRLLEHFQVLLDGAVADPGRPVAELPLLDAAEQHQLRLAGEGIAEAPGPEAPAPAKLESRAELEARVAQRRSGLSASKRDLLEQRLRGKAAKASGPETPSRIPRRRESGPAPLSFAQERLWFLDRLEPGSPAYNIPVALRLEGELDLPALSRALAEIRRRHEVLRATFGERDGQPFQAVAEARDFALPRVDLGGLAEGPREAELLRLVREDAARPFDLARGPLLRTALLRLGAQSHALLLSAHHIVFDAWSSGIFTREMGTLYTAFAAGRPSALAELPIQYADFAAWQVEWLRGDALEAELAWWRQRLAGAPPALNLPTDRPRPAVVSPRGDARVATFPARLAQGLRQRAREEGATLFMVALAGFQALLSRYAREEDVSVGTPVAGRSRLEIEPLIGFFVNTLVLRTELSGDPSFRELTRRVREVTLGAFAHQDLPFEKLVQELNPARSLARTPLFQVVFSLHNAAAETFTLPGLSLRSLGDGSPTAKFDLTLGLEEGEAGLNAILEHSTDLFDGATAERLLEHLGVLLAAAIESPGSRLSELPLLAAAEREQVVVEWNATRVDYGVTGAIPDLFEAQAERSPDRTAVVFEGQSLSYRELDRRANGLAWRLRDAGVGPESLVGVYLERSFEMVVSLLAILKAGGAYVPLDPEYPRERLDFMVADSGIGVLLALEPLPGFSGTWIRPDGDERADAAPQRSLSDASLAYVIYTSGSTGRPKGAMNTQGALRNRLLWMQEAYGLTAEDRVLQKTPFSFDVSVWEFFWPLLTGASLVLARPGGHRVGSYLRELIVEEGITTLHFVPSMLAVFLEEEGLEECRSLVRVLASGEALPPETVERFFARLDAELHNLYGPTEAAIDVTAWPCPAGAGRAVIPIGRPIANLRIHILEPGLTPAGVGLPGELYIGGEGLARGYFGRPELTAERFVPDPFSARAGERLYRTGDLARWSRQGEIEFLGRVDFQVKLRGFRIELGEIEAALGRHPGVRESVVVLREERLVAYVVPAAGPVAAGKLRGFLRERLPEHMVPSTFVSLAALPLSPNGKVERRLLPAPEGERGPEDASYVAPRTP